MDKKEMNTYAREGMHIEKVIIMDLAQKLVYI